MLYRSCQRLVSLEMPCILSCKKINVHSGQVPTFSRKNQPNALRDYGLDTGGDIWADGGNKVWEIRVKEWKGGVWGATKAVEYGEEASKDIQPKDTNA